MNEIETMKSLAEEIHSLGLLFVEHEKERQRQLEEIDNAISRSKEALNAVKESHTLYTLKTY